MKIKDKVGIIGSIMLFTGVFAPIISAPIIGNINYFCNGKGDGVFILICAIISLILILINKHYKFLLWLTGIISLGITFFGFVNLIEIISQSNSGILMNCIQLQWGWALLIIGSVLVIVSAAMKDET